MGTSMHDAEASAPRVIDRMPRTSATGQIQRAAIRDREPDIVEPLFALVRGNHDVVAG